MILPLYLRIVLLAISTQAFVQQSSVLPGTTITIAHESPLNVGYYETSPLLDYSAMKFGILGGGAFSLALAKVLSYKNVSCSMLVRNQEVRTLPYRYYRILS
jgi:hypothetical protein